LFRIDEGPWAGKTLYELYKEAYMPWEWQPELKTIANDLGLYFFSTPFDKTSVDFLEKMGVNEYKISSFEITDIPLIEYAASKGKRMMLSTGMATEKEIEDAIKSVKNMDNNDIILLKCTSAYPAPLEDMNLMTIPDMKKKFKLPVGLSDHTPGILAPVIATSLGAAVIEKHLTLSRSVKTPDSDFSLEPQEFESFVNAVRAAEVAMGKVMYGPSGSEMSNIAFRRSVFAVKDIKKGDIFSDDNVKALRPGYGHPPSLLKKILGRKSMKNIPRGSPIQYLDFWIK
jgi:pseudaminic acid synthase